MAGDPCAQRQSGPERLELLRQALDGGALLPWFQPKVALGSGQLKGVEALARWDHPRHGMLDAERFAGAPELAPQLDELLSELTLRMLEQVLRLMDDWRRAGMPPLAVALNVPAAGLADRALVDRLARAVQQAGVAPAALLWEVGEADLARCLSVGGGPVALPPPATRLLANMGRLRLMGFGLALDDFDGAALSLRQFACCPLTELKLAPMRGRDEAGIGALGGARAAIMDLARRLGVATVAEAVETEHDWKLQRAAGCDMAQGHLLARPMPAGELAAWMRSDRRRLRALALDG